MIKESSRRIFAVVAAGFVSLGLAACDDGTKTRTVTETRTVTDTTVVTETTGPLFTDADGDNYPLDIDCDDNNADVNPGAAEVYYNGVDDDCDAATIDDDQDGDGTIVDNDCDDTNASVHPGAPELDDGIDNNCDGDAEELGSFDKDGDGYSPLFGSAADPTPDCNDDDASVNPGMSETYYNGVDDDCDAATIDDDQDGDGDPVGSDCDDTNANRSSLMSEAYYDGEDNDCDLSTQDLDHDGDGFDAATFGGDDCADNDASRNPGRVEMPNDGIDNDCDGSSLTAGNGNGIYVSTSGDDGTGDGTMANPYATVQHGADRASSSGVNRVYIAEGVYVESVDAGASLIGGFNSDFSVFDPMSFRATITSTAPGSAAVTVSDGAEFQAIGLDLAAASGPDNMPRRGLELGEVLSARIYASAISTGSSNGGAGTYDARGIEADNSYGSGLFTIQDSTVDTYGGPNLSNLRGIQAQYFTKTVLDGVTVTVHGDAHASDQCRPLDLYQTNGFIVDSAFHCDSSVQPIGGDTYYLNLESGVYDLRDSTAGSTTETLGGYLSFIYLGGAELRAANNTFAAGDHNGSDLVYIDYSTAMIDGLDLTCGDNSGNGTALYFDYGSLDLRDSSFACGDAASGTNYTIEQYYSHLRSWNNSVDFGYMGGDTYMNYVQYSVWDSWNDSFEYEEIDGTYYGAYLEEGGELDSTGLKLTISDYVDSDFYTVYNYYQTAWVRDADVFVQEVDGDFYGTYMEQGAHWVDDSYFEAVTVGGSLYAQYAYYGGAWYNGNTYTFGEADYSYGLNCEYASCEYRNESLTVGPTNGGQGAYLGGTHVLIADSTFDLVGSRPGSNGDFTGFYHWCCNVMELYDNYVNVATSDAELYGVDWACCGEVIMEGNVITLGDSQDDVYGFYTDCCNTLDLVNNVIEVTGTTYNDSSGYGLYLNCCEGSYVVNNYFGLSNVTAGTNYGIYSNSSWGHAALVNNIVNAGRANEVYGVYLSDEEAVSFKHNLLTTPDGMAGFDTGGLFFSDSDVGALDTFAELNDCDDATTASHSVECFYSDGNFFAELNAIFVNRAAGDYRHKGTSPAVDAGGAPQPQYPRQLANVDAEGTPRPQGSAFDVGPDELAQ